MTLAYFLERWSCLDPCNTSYNSSSSNSTSSSLSDNSESDSGTINADRPCRASLPLCPARLFWNRLGAAANAGALLSRFAYNEAHPFISPAKGIKAVTSCRKTQLSKKERLFWSFGINALEHGPRVGLPVVAICPIAPASQ